VNTANPEQKAEVYADAYGKIRFQHNDQPVPEGWIQDPNANGSYQAKREWTMPQKRKFQKDAQIQPKLAALVNGFKPYFSQLGRAPTRIINRALARFNREDLLKYANKTLDSQAREAALWWAEFMRVYSLKERYELFGATLTNNELSSWEQALGIVQGQNPTHVRRRLEQLYNDYTHDLLGEFNSQYVGTAHPANHAYLDSIGEQHGYLGREGSKYRFSANPDEITPWQYDDEGNPLQGIVDDSGAAIQQPAAPVQGVPSGLSTSLQEKIAAFKAQKNGS